MASPDNKIYDLKAHDLEHLLELLDPDREIAERKLAALQDALHAYFYKQLRGDGRPLRDAEDCASETIFRAMVYARKETVTREQIIPGIWKIARNFQLEYFRKSQRLELTGEDPPGVPAVPGGIEKEIEFQEKRARGLESCLGELESGDSEMLLEYYGINPRNKEKRERLASKYGLTRSQLTKRVNKLKNKISKRIKKYMDQE
jgi:DNA-directed RNA polymerase specialized sigma24 family protein